MRFRPPGACWGVVSGALSPAPGTRCRTCIGRARADDLRRLSTWGAGTFAPPDRLHLPPGVKPTGSRRPCRLSVSQGVVVCSASQRRPAQRGRRVHICRGVGAQSSTAHRLDPRGAPNPDILVSSLYPTGRPMVQEAGNRHESRPGRPGHLEASSSTSGALCGRFACLCVAGASGCRACNRETRGMLLAAAVAESKQPNGHVARSCSISSLSQSASSPGAAMTEKNLGGTGPMLPPWKAE